MKKILLIPTLLTTSVVSLSCLSSLTSCGKHNYSKDYLTFEALEDGQLSCDIFIQLGSPEINLNVQYSLNNGKWTTLEVNKDNEYTNYLPYKTGDKIRLKGINDCWSYDDNDNRYFSSLHFTGLVNASGNIMSLLYGDDFADKETIPCDSCFEKIFAGSTPENGDVDFAQIKDTSNLFLPATTLTDRCYAGMFMNCDSLINAPELPATTLTSYCYHAMFENCDSLRDAPELPATTLANDCYYSMFQDCDALVDAPALPATTLASSCYYSMFQDCDALDCAPSLPATTLASNCYYSMFQDCDALLKAPELLPATTLDYSCYYSMFNGCNCLVTAPELPATTLAYSCYSSMFKNCTSLIVNKNHGDDDKLIFTCPDEDPSYIISWTSFMFSDTKGDHGLVVESNTSYYWAEE